MFAECAILLNVGIILSTHNAQVHFQGQRDYNWVRSLIICSAVIFLALVLSIRLLLFFVVLIFQTANMTSASKVYWDAALIPFSPIISSPGGRWIDIRATFLNVALVLIYWLWTGICPLGNFPCLYAVLSNVYISKSPSNVHLLLYYLFK